MGRGTALHETMEDSAANVYYSEGFRNVIEYHLPKLKSSVNTASAAVPQNLGLRHEHDFYGLLVELKIPTHLQWITLRLNDMTDPSEFRVDRQRILIPDRGDLNAIRTTYTMIHKI